MERAGDFQPHAHSALFVVRAGIVNKPAIDADDGLANLARAWGGTFSIWSQ
jgi:hypothetical protein